MFRSTALFAALIAGAATLNFPAQAGEVDGSVRTAKVGYSDLNLASAAGSHALRDRVTLAAQRVCTVDGDPSLQQAMQARSCMKQALATAMPQVELALAGAGTRLAQNSHLTVTAR